MANRFLSNITINDSYTFPSADGDAGQIITTDGSGNLSFTDISNVAGAASNFVYYTVKNSSGATINKGAAVRAVGTDGNSGHILIDEMVADGTVEPKYFMGVLESTLDNGEIGRVIHFGELDQFNTNAFQDGDVLWCDPATPGGFTTTEPEGPNVKIAAAIVINASTNGKIKVRVQGNEGLHELHDVKITTQADGEILVWDNTTGVWMNDGTLTVDYTNGRVGIGESNPSDNLHISGATASIRLQDSDGTDTFGRLRYTGSSVYFTSRNNTSAGNFIWVGSNGSVDDEFMRLNSSGRLGIGVSSPGALLHVNSGTTDLVARFESTDGSGKIEIKDSNDSVYVGTVAGNRMYLGFDPNAGETNLTIRDDGKVGVGTLSPNSALEVASSVTFSNVDTFGQFVIKSTSGTTGDLLNFGVDSANSLAFIQANDRGTSSIPLILQRYSGDVGIGVTPSSGYKLDVAGSIRTNSNLVANNVYSGSGTFVFGLSTSLGEYITSVGNDIRFYAGGSAVATIDGDNSRVGIGTTSPTTTLDVVGSATTNIDIAHFANSNEAPKIKISLDGVGSSLISMLDSGNNEDVRLSTQGNSWFNAGNVGIGTPSPSAELHVKGAGEVIRLQGDTGQSYMTFYQGTGGRVGYIGTSGSSGMVLESAAQLHFYSGGSSTMYLDSNSNVGIGTTSPQAGKRLDVRSDASISGSQAIAGYGYNETSTAIIGQGYATSGTGTNYGIRGVSNGPRTGGVNVAGHFSADSAGTNYALITGNGNVGINTSSPSYLFEVNTTSVSTYVAHFTKNGASLGGMYVDSINNGEFYVKASGNNTTVLLNSSGSSYLNGGNVGIGTSSPQEKLHVVGKIYSTGQISTAGGSSNDILTQYVTIKDLTSTDDYVLRFRNSSGSQTGYIGKISTFAGFTYQNSNGHKFNNPTTIASTLTLTSALKGPSTFYIDPSPDDTAEPGGATTDTGTVVILGDLQVTGTTTTIDSTTLNVGDKNIVLAKDATTAAEANGAGITINGASATLTYNSTNDNFVFNKDIDAPNFDLQGVTDQGAITTNEVTIKNTIYSEFGSGNTDITGLLSGSTFGTWIKGRESGHVVIGLRDNDNNDSFAILSGSGNYTTDTTYDKLLARFEANGNITLGGNTNISSGALKIGNVTVIDSSRNFYVPDNSQIKIGSSSDLLIYHDGNNSYIQENGTGELRINSDNAVRIRKHDNETMALFTANGSASLWYDNSLKIETTSSGVGISGTATASRFQAPSASFGDTGNSSVAIGYRTMTFDSSNYPAIITNQHADLSIGTNVYVDTNHDLVAIKTHGNIAGSAIVFGGNFHPNGNDTISFYTKGGGGATAGDIYTAESAEMVLNSTGLGIGTTSPSVQLDIEDSGNVLVDLNTTTANANTTIRFQESGSNTATIGYDGTNDGLILTTGGFTAGNGIFIDNNGDIGIGTDSPIQFTSNAYSLTIGGSHTGVSGALFHKINGTNKAYQYASVSTGYTFNSLDSKFTWLLNSSTTAMSINSSGVVINSSVNYTNQALQVNGFIDQVNTTAAFRLYNGSTFVGGLGNGQWAFSSTYLNDYALYATADLLFSAGGGSSPDMILNANGDVGIGQTSPIAKLDVSGSIRAGGKTTYGKAYSSLDTTGQAVAGLVSGGNGQSCAFIFTCVGGSGYQKIVYNCINSSGTWNVSKDIDEGANAFDVVASANAATITFTFKGRTANQSYTPQVSIEHIGSGLNTTYL